jgi:inner membrane protein
MNGTAHATMGGAIGFVTANIYQAEPATTVLFVGLGAVAALVPDLDVGGKLRGKLTVSHKVIRGIVQLIAILFILYSYLEATAQQQLIGIAIGILMFLFSFRLKQKHMLTLTSIGVIIGGASLQEIWLTLFGVYMLLASFVAHRTYTHSILGILFFAIIAREFEASVVIDGVYITLLVSYISHLIGDSKYLPFNSRGIKLFLPLSKKEV